MTTPRTIRRQYGGWLAVSPLTEDIKIGTCGSTEAEAVELYSAALARWRALNTIAASSLATDQISGPLPQHQ